MRMRISAWFLVLAYMSVSIDCSTDDLNKNRSYINIKKAIPCIRRFNATHQIGCGRDDIGQFEGIVVAVRNKDEFDATRALVINNKSKLRRKLVLVTVSGTFRDTVEFYLTESEYINGIVLVATNDTTLLDYSDDQNRPNERFSVYGELTRDWNPTGSGYMLRNFDVPFYLVTDSTESELIFNNCYDKFNSHLLSPNRTSIDFSASLCGMQLGMQMSGALSSEVCARRNNIQHTLDTANTYCDPLGGSGGTYLSFLSQKPSNEKPILLVTARLDSFTLFESYTPGASEPISSLVGLLALVDVLSNIRDKVDADMKTNIAFVVFDNEAFDYGGSSRFVNDLVNDQFATMNTFFNATHSSVFRLNKQNISALVELSQIGSIGLSSSDGVYVHWDSVSYESNKSISIVIDELAAKLTSKSFQIIENLISIYINSFLDFSGQFIRKINDINQQLPPSSLHSFLRTDVPSLPIPGISISDHQKEFKNKFYHSIFDTPASINITFPADMSEADAVARSPTLFATQLQKVVSALAKTIYSVSSNVSIDDALFQPDLDTINKLVYCFYQNASCSFFQNALGAKEWTSYNKQLASTLPNGKLSFYTSVSDILVTGKYVTLELLKYFSRDRTLQQLNATQCDKTSPEILEYQNKTGRTLRDVKLVNNMTICMAATVYKVPSISPAFAKFDSDGVLVQADKYSAWSESSWDGVAVQMKLFMFPDRGIEGLTIGLGIVTFVLAILPIYLMNKYSNRVFGEPESCAAAVIDSQSNEVFT